MAWWILAGLVTGGGVMFLSCRVAAHMRNYRTLLAVFPAMQPPTLWQMIRYPLRKACRL